MKTKAQDTREGIAELLADLTEDRLQGWLTKPHLAEFSDLVNIELGYRKNNDRPVEIAVKHSQLKKARKQTNELKYERRTFYKGEVYEVSYHVWSLNGEKITSYETSAGTIEADNIKITVPQYIADLITT